MNSNETFVPVWAEKVFGSKDGNSSDTRLLWSFFDAWEALHAIKGDKRNPDIRKQYEDAAQALIDAAQPLRILRKQNGN